ncbi:17302_t:CDS:2, partial [Funneliformis caledonium]
MNETPIWFDMLGNLTVNNKGDKTVHICITRNDKNHFTVVLTCSADSTKYPSICIFKEKQLPHDEVISKSNSAMMVYDSFRSYLKENIKVKFKQHNFHLVVIPAGLTS